MKRNYRSKFTLILTFSLLLLSGCRRFEHPSLPSSENPESSHYVTSGEASDSGTINEVTSDVVSSESVSSDSSEMPPSQGESSEIPSTSTSQDPTSGSSEEIPTSYDCPVDPDISDERTFIDDVFHRSYCYNPASYDIEGVIPTTNPYLNINSDAEKEIFYTVDYNRATSYEDAMFRTEQGLISGDIKDTRHETSYPLNHLPNRKYRLINEYRVNEGVYEYHTNGDFKSYTINNLEGKVKKIYFGAGYVSLEDVAAYLFAFGEGPANYSKEKSSSAQRQMIDTWGIYGRVNDAYYSSDVTQYLYEPSLPHTDNGGSREADMYNYHELDFGYTQTPWGYGIPSEEPYNNGTRITRGTVRFVYSASTYEGQYGAKYIPVEHRHVFLTFNHYNDFIEYLNYEGGWGIPFGWMSAGNDYVAGMSASKYGPGYYDFVDPYPQTLYPVPEVKSLSELQNILHSL